MSAQVSGQTVPSQEDIQFWLNSVTPQPRELRVSKTCAICPNKGFCLFSGGKDSTVVAHKMEKEKRLEGCIFIDTTIGIPDCKEFVKEECARQGWPLTIIKSEISYEEFVLRYGFPSVSWHAQAMQALKYHAMRIFRRQYVKENDHPPLLFSGIRKFESARRFKGAVLDKQFLEGCWWEQPIRLYTTELRNKALEENDVHINPIYKILHYSGECLCGSFADNTEKFMIKTFFPDMAKKIEDLENKAHAQGLRYWRWGNTESYVEAKSQTNLESTLCSNCFQDRSQECATEIIAK